MNPAIEHPYNAELILELSQREEKFKTLFTPSGVDVHILDVGYRVIVVTEAGKPTSEPLLKMTPCFNSRVKNPMGIFLVDNYYLQLQYHLRSDLWAAWRKPELFPGFRRDINYSDLLPIINGALYDRSNHRVLAAAFGHTGSRITSNEAGHWVYGYGSQIACHIFRNGDPHEDALKRFMRNGCVEIPYAEHRYWVMMPHANDMRLEPASFKALAYALVPMIHSFDNAKHGRLG